MKKYTFFEEIDEVEFTIDDWDGEFYEFATRMSGIVNVCYPTLDELRKFHSSLGRFIRQEKDRIKRERYDNSAEM